jgi:hypothetical protein
VLDDPKVTVPLIVDDVKTEIVFPMTRMIYFYIDGEESLTPWNLGLGSITVPFRMLGLTGIILGPANGQSAFSGWRQVSDLFGAVEAAADRNLSVDTADVFLPNWLFKKAGLRPNRNDVFRAVLSIFAAALEYRQGRQSLEEFEVTIGQLASISFSEIETQAFRDWAAEEMEESREYFRSELAVRRRQDDINRES